jgi:hypothetical protein
MTGNCLFASLVGIFLVVDVDLEMGCLMLAGMEPDLQMKFESFHVHDMVMALKDMFAT